MADGIDPGRHRPSRSERFFAGYLWLILKNLLGWTLILLSLVAGPLVPGPGGIPLFLIGFALVNFPGKRRLTARVLRGRPIRLNARILVLCIAGVALVLPTLGLGIVGTRLDWLNGLRTGRWRVLVSICWPSCCLGRRSVRQCCF